jgi:hypothetical protein
MPKKPKSKPKKSKPGPKEEVLVIHDPQAAIDALLRKKPTPGK